MFFSLFGASKRYRSALLPFLLDNSSLSGLILAIDSLSGLNKVGVMEGLLIICSSIFFFCFSGLALGLGVRRTLMFYTVVG